MGNLVAFTLATLFGSALGAGAVTIFGLRRLRRLMASVGDSAEAQAQYAFDEASRAESARTDAEMARDESEQAANRAETALDSLERALP